MAQGNPSVLNRYIATWGVNVSCLAGAQYLKAPCSSSTYLGLQVFLHSYFEASACMLCGVLAVGFIPASQTEVRAILLYSMTYCWVPDQWVLQGLQGFLW